MAQDWNWPSKRKIIGELKWFPFVDLGLVLKQLNCKILTRWVQCHSYFLFPVPSGICCPALCWPMDIALQRYREEVLLSFMCRTTAREGSCYCSLCLLCARKENSLYFFTWFCICTYFLLAQIILLALMHIIMLRRTLTSLD